MALLHNATITPSKSDLIAKWIPTQVWGPPTEVPIDMVGAFRFDDPEGQVGMEIHLVKAGDRLLQVPLTYRDTPLAGADEALVSEMEHSALGTRWIYDGLFDPQLVLMLAAVTMTGQGEALGMAEYEGRWYIAPSRIRIQGGGWTGKRVPVDRFVVQHSDETSVLLSNDRFELTVYRQPVEGPRPAIGLTATWAGQTGPVVLSKVEELSESVG